MPTRFVYNDTPGGSPAAGISEGSPLEFHRSFPGYAPTPLHEWPELAAELGVRTVYVKDESRRLGLPSFKVMGASWAIACALAERVPGLFDGGLRFDAIDGCALPELTLLAATDGNHGHAVARIASLLSLRSKIFVPSNLPQERVAPIEAEGAAVQIVDGTYDDAVRRSAREAGGDRLLISDTSWPGYVATPRRVIAGYSTILREIDEQLASRNGEQPGLVLAQIGVGAFASAVTLHYRDRERRRTPRIVGVEPLSAACVMASIVAGRRVEVPGPHDSIMAGLNCGIPSVLAWPILHNGLDAALAIDDEGARDGMRRFASAGMVAGECAGAAPAAAIELLLGSDSTFHRRRLGLDASSVILMFLTEGATKPSE